MTKSASHRGTCASRSARSLVVLVAALVAGAGGMAKQRPQHRHGPFHGTTA